jgi:predicted AlkP superfamily phosphohydrolase/phosphomutase
LNYDLIGADLGIATHDEEAMTRQRVLAIGLDGFEITLAERLMAQGRMPHLNAIRKNSARYLLDHGEAKYTGLAWEHVSSGRTPEALSRFSAVTFQPDTYHVSQDVTRIVPVFAHLTQRTVLFDVPYCDLRCCPNAVGIANWGAHDPGVPPSSNPESLAEELMARFGPYPAGEHIYAMVWHSAEQTRAAAQALLQAVRVRARAAEWMLTERSPDWQFAMIVVSESHSAAEPFWHGIDLQHPLHLLPSARAAGDGVNDIYEEIDALIGRLAAAAPDAALVIFAMHGMGANDADVASMALLPELLYRRQFGKEWMRDLPWRNALASGAPLLAEDQTWHFAMEDRVPPLWSDAVQEYLASRTGCHQAGIENVEIDWQPASRYRPFWPQMEAFALPSFYDGRVRLNIAGRERYGIVAPNRRRGLTAEILDLLEACRDSITGLPVIADYRKNASPFDQIGSTEADLYIYWDGLVSGLDHPTLGRIGPLPFRRTGGHSGAHGFLYCANVGVSSGDHGVRSSFDVVPTLLSLLGEEVTQQRVSGRTLLPGGKPRRRHAQPA